MFSNQYLYLRNAGAKLVWILLALCVNQTKKKYIITCMDYFSKYIEAKAIENKTGSTVATFIHELICKYGVMDITITDQGNLSFAVIIL